MLPLRKITGILPLCLVYFILLLPIAILHLRALHKANRFKKAVRRPVYVTFRWGLFGVFCLVLIPWCAALVTGSEMETMGTVIGSVIIGVPIFIVVRNKLHKKGFFK